MAGTFWWESTTKLWQLTSTGRAEFVLPHCWTGGEPAVLGLGALAVPEGSPHPSSGEQEANLMSRSGPLMAKWTLDPMVVEQIWTRLRGALTKETSLSLTAALPHSSPFLREFWGSSWSLWWLWINPQQSGTQRWPACWWTGLLPFPPVTLSLSTLGQSLQVSVPRWTGWDEPDCLFLLYRPFRRLGLDPVIENNVHSEHGLRLSQSSLFTALSCKTTLIQVKYQDYSEFMQDTNRPRHVMSIEDSKINQKVMHCKLASTLRLMLGRH